MLWRNTRIVAFDTETTGLDPLSGDRVIEFGAVTLEVDAGGRVSNVTAYDTFLQPGIPIPREASRISGITDDDVKDAPEFGEVVDEIVGRLEGSVVVAHNLGFDLGFIRSELERCGRVWPETLAEVDTLPLSQRLIPNLRSHALGSICEELGVALEKAHRASADAEACGRALIEMCRLHQAPAELEAFVAWADAVSPPPLTGHLVRGEDGRVHFLDGPWRGRAIDLHPDHLQWMTIALERREGRWHHRYPESVRLWVRRWLRARASGRGKGSSKGQGPDDWGLEPPVWARWEGVRG